MVKATDFKFDKQLLMDNADMRHSVTRVKCTEALQLMGHWQNGWNIKTNSAYTVAQINNDAPLVTGREADRQMDGQTRYERCYPR